MRKLLVSMIVALILPFLFMPADNTADAVGSVNISAKSAILIDATTGRVLYEKNADQIMPMASTTKIMTTLLSIESGNLDEYFTVDSKAIKVEGSSMGLVEGDQVTKRILCYGMMLPSGNDAANATAVKVAGSINNFAKLMNERAKRIGMKHSSFVTPSGLDDYTDYHYSTARDMALLTQEALKNPTFREICSTPKVELQYGNPPYTRWLYNSNKLLKQYNGCIGVKTGFTDKAKRCLVSACTRDGVTLICVTLNAPSDWNDHVCMYDYGFSMVKKVEIPIDSMNMLVHVVGGKREVAFVKQQIPATITMFGNNKPNVEKKVYLPKFIYAPAKKGDIIGRADYIINNQVVQSVPIVVDEDIKELYIEPRFSIKKFIRNVFD